MQRAIDVKILRYTYDSGVEYGDVPGAAIQMRPATFEVDFMLGEAKASVRLYAEDDRGTGVLLRIEHTAQLEALRRGILNGITSEAPAEWDGKAG